MILEYQTLYRFHIAYPYSVLTVSSQTHWSLISITKHAILLFLNIFLLSSTSPHACTTINIGSRCVLYGHAQNNFCSSTFHSVSASRDYFTARVISSDDELQVYTLRPIRYCRSLHRLVIITRLRYVILGQLRSLPLYTSYNNIVIHKTCLMICNRSQTVHDKHLNKW